MSLVTTQLSLIMEALKNQNLQTRKKKSVTFTEFISQNSSISLNLRDISL